MRIAFLCPHDLGIQVFVGPFARALAGRPDVHLHALAPCEFQYDLKDLRSLGVDVQYVDMSRFMNPVNDIRYILSMARRLRALQPDVVVCFTTKPNVYGSIAARIAGIETIVCAVRGLGAPFLPPQSIRDRVLQAAVVGLYKIAGRLSSVMWFTNLDDRARLIQEGIIEESRTILTANGVDIKTFAPESVGADVQARLRADLDILPDDQVVIMVARLSWPKGVREFVEAARIVRAMYPNTHFLLVGPIEDRSDGVPRSYLERCMDEGVIKWLGFRADTRELYSIADLAVLPSYYKEGGYPRALLEPMSMAKPVVGCDTPDCRGPVEEGGNGFLVPARDEKSLAETVSKVLGDEDLRRRFGVRSRVRVEQEFDDSKIVRRIVGELEYLVSTRGSGRKAADTPGRVLYGQGADALE